MPDTVALDARRHALRARLLVAVAVFNVWVWGTRLVNLIRDPDGFDASIPVHVVLFIVSLGAAVGIGVVGWQMRGEARRSTTVE